MNLTSYVENLRRELAVAAEGSGEEARALAERLSGALESATRLALLEALSAAADEITRDLAPGSVEVRLRGRDPEFVVTQPEPAAGPESPAGEHTSEASSKLGLGGRLGEALAGAIEVSMGVRPPAASSVSAADAEEGGGTSRMTLRLPEHLKPSVEEAAASMGLSVNAWLVRVIVAALELGDPDRHAPGGGRQFGRRYTGWVG
jgi:hypothetical protein